MTEAKPAYWRLLRRLVSISPLWSMSSCGLRRSRPLTCTLLSGQVIGGSLVVYCPILEKGGAEVCIDTTAMVAGVVAETEKNEVVSSFQRSAGGTDA